MIKYEYMYVTCQWAKQVWKTSRSVPHATCDKDLSMKKVKEKLTVYLFCSFSSL